MMYSKLIQTVSRHMELDPARIALSKFMHSSDRGTSKVLFLATAEGGLVGILKMLRDATHNDKLRNEKRGQTEASSVLKTFQTPRVYFEDVVGGHYVYFEEVVRGKPIGKAGAAAFVPSVLAYQKEIPKGADMPVEEIVQLFSSWKEAPKLYHTFLKQLEEKGGVLTAGRSHGDVTYMNILKGDNGFFLIDWERYGERPMWGLDFVHYVTRCVNAEDLQQFTAFLRSCRLSPDEEYFARAYLADRLFDMLQKQKPSEYQRVTSELHARIQA